MDVMEFITQIQEQQEGDSVCIRTNWNAAPPRCAECGAPRGGITQKYCSPRCSKAALRKRNTPKAKPRFCADCGADISNRNGGTMRCEKCAPEHNRQMSNARRRRKREV